MADISIISKVDGKLVEQTVDESEIEINRVTVNKLIKWAILQGFDPNA